MEGAANWMCAKVKAVCWRRVSSLRVNYVTWQRSGSRNNRKRWGGTGGTPAPRRERKQTHREPRQKQVMRA